MIVGSHKTTLIILAEIQYEPVRHKHIGKGNEKKRWWQKNKQTIKIQWNALSKLVVHYTRTQIVAQANWVTGYMVIEKKAFGCPRNVYVILILSATFRGKHCQIDWDAVRPALYDHPLVWQKVVLKCRWSFDTGDTYMHVYTMSVWNFGRKDQVVT